MAGLVGCHSGRQQSWRGRKPWEKGYRGQGLPSREDWLRTGPGLHQFRCACVSRTDQGYCLHLLPQVGGCGQQARDTTPADRPRPQTGGSRQQAKDPAPRWVVSDNRLRILPKLTDPAPRWVFPEGRMFHRALGNSNSHQPWQPGSSVAAVPLHLPPSSASESGQPALAAGWPAGLPTVPAPSESSPGRPPGSS